MEPRAQELADRLIAKWTSPTGTELMAAGAAVVGRVLAEGPLTVETAAKVLNWPAEDVLKRFEELDFPLEQDEDGRIVGAGLSLLPSSPHMVDLDGRVYHGWCVMDLMMFPLVFGKAAPATTLCPASGTLISMTVTANGLGGLEPPTAWLTLAPATGGEIREVFCNRINMYVDEATARAAAAADPDLAVCSAAEGWGVAKQLADLF